MQSRKSRNTRVTCKFGLGVQKEAGQRLIEFCQENTLVIANALFPTTQETILHMDVTTWTNTKIRLIILVAVKDGKALYSQQTQDRELMWLRPSAPYCKSQAEIKESSESH